MKSRLYLYGPPDCGKTILRELLEYYNKDKYVLTHILDINSNKEKLDHVRCIDLDPFTSKTKNCKIIFIFRDPRICWLVTIEKDKFTEDRNNYLSIIDQYLITYKNYVKEIKRSFLRYDYYMHIRFEDLLLNFEETTTSISSFLELEFDLSYSKPKVFANNFTKFDVYKLIEYIKFINQTHFDYISEHLKDEIELFGYPKHLDFNSIAKS